MLQQKKWWDRYKITYFYSYMLSTLVNHIECKDISLTVMSIIWFSYLKTITYLLTDIHQLWYIINGGFLERKIGNPLVYVRGDQNWFVTSSQRPARILEHLRPAHTYAARCGALRCGHIGNSSGHAAWCGASRSGESKLFQNGSGCFLSTFMWRSIKLSVWRPK